MDQVHVVVHGPRSMFCIRPRQHDPFRAKEIINRRILPQQTSQIYMYSSFFKRERQYDLFIAKEIMNRRILPQTSHSSFLKRASPNTPLDERGIFTHFCPRAKLLHSSGESTLISGEITPGKQDIRRNNPVSIELAFRGIL